MPRRDLASHPQVQDYLKNHKVYVSFSTSPKNLSKLLPMLRTLDLELVEKIYLALPEKYRNTQEYGPIPPEILNFTKLEIIARDQKDLGPIMKMLPAIEKVAALDPYALVISIDDDTGFPKGMVNELIYYSVLYPNAIISGAGHYAKFFGISPEEWPAQGRTTQAPFCGFGEISYCDTVEGWMGIAYKPHLVNTERIKQIAALSKACKTSDDLVISYVLAESGVERIRTVNSYFPHIHRFAFEEHEGALHKTTIETPGWSPRMSVDGFFSGSTNSARYQRCVLDIKPHP